MLIKHHFTVPKCDFLLPVKTIAEGGYLLRSISLETASVVAVLPEGEAVTDYWPHAAIVSSEDVSGAIVDALLHDGGVA
jgi:hypothetical protein